MCGVVHANVDIVNLILKVILYHFYVQLAQGNVTATTAKTTKNTAAMVAEPLAPPAA